MTISRRQLLLVLGAVGTPALGRVGNIKIGVCKGTTDFEDAARYGFDYLEPGVAEIAGMDEAKFRAFKAQVLSSPLRCESFNSFIRKLRVVGNDVRRDDLRAYLEMSLARCHELGGSVVVWGSAGSRNVSEGYSRDRAWQDIQAFLRLAGDIAQPLRLVIAVEPLRKQESNIINTAAEALRLVREVDHPHVKMIVDYYHLREENEDPEIIWGARKEIVHFHFANPRGRVWPRSPNEDPMYGRFFELVKRIQFGGRISIEAQGTFEKAAAASLAFFRQELG